MNSVEVADLLNKASQSLDAARHLNEKGFNDFSAGRSYYAMFYAVEALFLVKKQSYSKHGAIISAFGKEFVKSGLVDSKYHRFILEAFELRNAGDYGIINSVSREKAAHLINMADEFIQMANSFLAGKQYTSS